MGSLTSEKLVSQLLKNFFKFYFSIFTFDFSFCLLLIGNRFDPWIWKFEWECCLEVGMWNSNSNQRSDPINTYAMTSLYIPTTNLPNFKLPSWLPEWCMLHSIHYATLLFRAYFELVAARASANRIHSLIRIIPALIPARFRMIYLCVSSSVHSNDRSAWKSLSTSDLLRSGWCTD